MASPQLQAIIQAFRSEPVREGMTIEQARAGLENLAALSPVGPEVSVEPIDAEGVPAEWVSAPGATNAAT
ncbi:MAG: hypothetical protein ABIU97_00035, partial [Dehalococcoidia bacterium]